VTYRRCSRELFSFNTTVSNLQQRIWTAGGANISSTGRAATPPPQVTLSRIETGWAGRGAEKLYELRMLRSGMDVWKNGGVDVSCLHTSTPPYIHTRILQTDSVLLIPLGFLDFEYFQGTHFDSGHRLIKRD